MFSLPRSTEIRKQISKKLIYTKFSAELKGERKNQFDNDISKIVILNEISPASINIPEGEQVKAIFVIQVILKDKNYNERNLVLLSKLFGQNMIFVLQYEDEYQLAIYQTRLLASDWYEDEVKLAISGLSLDKVWEQMVSQISGIVASDEKSLDEQIAIEEQKTQISKKILDLEKKARKEVQSKKKYEMFQRIKEYQKQLEEL